MHAPFWAQRARIIKAFEGDGRPTFGRRAEKLGLCCVTPVLAVERGRVPVLVPGRCRDRMCPLCARFRGHVARDRIRGLVNKADSLRMMTLTQDHAGRTLGEAIDAQSQALTRLRRLAGWKKHVRGGLFVIEVTRGRNGDRWHVHTHVLVEGSYYDCKALTADWSVAVGKPSVSDIRAVHSRNQAASYVTKYVTKGTDDSGWSDATIVEYAEGVHRRRLYGTFGKWHKVDVTEDRDAPDDRPCPRTRVSWSQIIEGLRSGTLDADVHVPLLARVSPLAPRLLMEFKYTRPAIEVPLVADDYEQLTLFGLELTGTHVEEPPAPPPPTTAAARFTTTLFPQANVHR